MSAHLFPETRDALFRFFAFRAEKPANVRADMHVVIVRVLRLYLRSACRTEIFPVGPLLVQ